VQEFTLAGLTGAKYVPYKRQQVLPAFTYMNFINMDVDFLLPGCYGRPRAEG
jgi:hypothetical protein